MIDNFLQPHRGEPRLMNVTFARMTASLAASPAYSMPQVRIDAETTRLAAEAREGSAEAFCALIDLHQRAARRVAAAALGSGVEADEAVQEACITAWQQIARLEDPAAFRAWLLRITWRKALDRRRSLVGWLKRIAGCDSRQQVAQPSVLDRLADPAQRADAQLLARERDEVIAQLIRSLPSKLRDPFLLAATGEHRYEDIATMLALPVGTVKWRVAEARRVLRQKLTRVGFGQ